MGTDYSFLLWRIPIGPMCPDRLYADRRGQVSGRRPRSEWSAAARRQRRVNMRGRTVDSGSYDAAAVRTTQRSLVGWPSQLTTAMMLLAQRPKNDQIGGAARV